MRATSGMTVKSQVPVGSRELLSGVPGADALTLTRP